MAHRYQFPRSPLANPKAIIQGDKWRFTLITSGILRFEWADDGVFEDRASVFALNRNQPVPEYKITETDTVIEISTDRMTIVYDRKPFTSAGFLVYLKGQSWWEGKWEYGPELPPDRKVEGGENHTGLFPSRNLGGTCRTLDDCDGKLGVEMSNGVCSVFGIAHLDDSDTMLFGDDGWVGPRRPGKREDGYVFAYGFDYQEAVKDFFKLSGNQPLLPRYSYNNWWSRYYAYTQQEYLDLMDRFKHEGLPFSVAVIDMDWHIVDVDKKHGNGWTGYTWNKDLFPDHVAFLQALHDRHLQVTLNLHPASGVREYEEQYQEMSKLLGKDPSTGEPIAFDTSDRKFLDAYFDVLHRKLEKEGVDFWWIDFQQGEHSRIYGIKNLDVLNHFHYLDSGIDNKRPITFSRWFGPGAQRYPVGFSGDTHVSWASLDFQPEMTATSSNIGYGLWSHDIGGHYFGTRDDALTARWTQYGVWSPILRLHSSNNPFFTKEPWVFPVETRKIMTDCLRYRARLIPYLYSMNVVSASDDGLPLVQPVYWHHPQNWLAYNYKNTYFFGSELLVFPITAPNDPITLLGEVKGWLPPGQWIDIFNGTVYDGDREVKIHRLLDQYPVFGRPGSIIPLDIEHIPENGGENPKGLEILLVVGADGEFDVYEDDGKGALLKDIQWDKITITYKQKQGQLSIKGAKGKSLKIRLIGYRDSEALKQHLGKGGVKSSQEVVDEGILISLVDPADNDFTLNIGADPQLGVIDPLPEIWKMLDRAQMKYKLKKDMWDALTAKTSSMVKISQVPAMDLPGNLTAALLELLLADSRIRI